MRDRGDSVRIDLELLRDAVDQVAHRPLYQIHRTIVVLRIILLSYVEASHYGNVSALQNGEQADTYLV